MKRFVTKKVGNTVYTWEMTLTESLKWASAEFLVIATFFLVAYAFILVPAPLFFIVAFFYCTPSQRWIVNLLGIAISSLILFDYTHGWLMHMIFHSLGADNFLSNVVSFNIGIVIAHIILLMTGQLLMNDEKRTQRYVPSVLAVMVLLPLITFYLGRDILVPYHNSTEALNEVKKQEHYEIVKAYLLEKHFNQDGIVSQSFDNKEDLEKLRHESSDFLKWESELFKKAIADLGYQDDPLFKNELSNLTNKSTDQVNSKDVQKKSQVSLAELPSSDRVMNDDSLFIGKEEENKNANNNTDVVITISEIRNENRDITTKTLIKSDLKDQMFVMTTGNYTCIYKLIIDDAGGSKNIKMQSAYFIKNRDKSTEKDVGTFELKAATNTTESWPYVGQSLISTIYTDKLNSMAN